MKKSILITILFYLVKFGFAQNNENPLRDVKAQLTLQNTNILSSNSYGLGLEFSFFNSKNFSHGLYFSALESNLQSNFNYITTEPVLNMNDIGISNELEVFHIKKLQFSTNLTTGFTYLRLGNNLIKEGIGIREQSQKLHSEYYFLTQPGINLTMPITYTEKGLAINLSAQAKYRLLLGNNELFIGENVQNSFTFLIGLSIVKFKNK